MSEIIPFKKTLKPSDLVLRFMTSLGHKNDAEVYLKIFKSKNPESFAIVVLDEDVLRDEFDSVLFEIRYLTRLSLFPVVVIRASNDFLEKIGIESYFKRAKLAFNFLSDEFSEAEKLEFIKARIRKELIPLLHIDPRANLVQELAKLATTLRTSKIAFLRKEGGIANTETGNTHSIINLRFDYEDIIQAPTVSEKDKEFVKQSNELIRSCDHKIYLSAVSPNNLLRELFTVKGAGTLIQLGSKIIAHKTWDTIDPKSIRRLLEHSFERKVKESFLEKKIDAYYIEENYMGAALLQNYKNMAYITKFAVGTEARGLGIGRDLWNEIAKNHKVIFWRSKPDKFITHWYVKQCDGMHKTDDWIVYWIGIKPSEITTAIEYALSLEEDFE